MIYEIYPRSFADADGDGLGDVRGILERLPYLRDLGVDGVWIAPWYPSPLADGGYDVSDHRGIHPALGTLEDAAELIDRAHGLGLRVVLDVVANHVSREHPWFVEAAAAAPGSPARRRFHFRPGRGPDGDQPPNNWQSAFGGPAWTRLREPDGRPGEWYLHTFAPEQPDLAWDLEEVAAEYDDVLRHWLRLGVDGFRFDAVPALAKRPGLPDATAPAAHDGAQGPWLNDTHWDVEEVHAVLRRWRGVLDDAEQATGRPVVSVAEAVVRTPERLARYVRPDELHTAFNFDLVHAPWSAPALRAAIGGSIAALASTGAPPTWSLSSHDETRHVTRFGRRPDGALDLALGRRRARAAALLLLGLPGSAYLYQGEELGLEEVEDLPDHLRQDPVHHRSGGTVPGRDGCRVPLPWSGTAAPFGFGPAGSEPWLPQPAGWAALTAEAQEGDPSSMLALYRRALTVRRTHAGFAGTGFAWVGGDGEAAGDGRDDRDEVVAFARDAGVVVILNLGPEPVELPGAVLLTSAPLADGLLASDAAAWVTTRPA